MTIRYRSHAYTNETERRAALEADVRRGLTSSPMSLPPKYFYDATGSKLFEDITELPEYYLTRTEAGTCWRCRSKSPTSARTWRNG